MEPKIRAFVAVEVGPDVCRDLARAAARLRQVGADVKWSDLEHLHLTLKFLGDIAASAVDPVKGVVESVARGLPPLELAFRTVGSFPPRGAPRVLWVGCEEGAGRLHAAARDLDQRLALLGAPREERDFAAHVTLGRVRSPRKADLLRAALAELAGSEFGRQTVTEVVLFQSELRPGGPVYTALARHPFAGAAGA